MVRNLTEIWYFLSVSIALSGPESVPTQYDYRVILKWKSNRWSRSSFEDTQGLFKCLIGMKLCISFRDVSITFQNLKRGIDFEWNQACAATQYIIESLLGSAFVFPYRTTSYKSPTSLRKVSWLRVPRFLSAFFGGRGILSLFSIASAYVASSKLCPCPSTISSSINFLFRFKVTNFRVASRSSSLIRLA